jgi:hypothetical protein
MSSWMYVSEMFKVKQYLNTPMEAQVGEEI